jgi:hypothetical protein
MPLSNFFESKLLRREYTFEGDGHRLAGRRRPPPSTLLFLSLRVTAIHSFGSKLSRKNVEGESTGIFLSDVDERG